MDRSSGGKRWKGPIAYQGEPGAFSELAVRRAFGRGAIPVSCPTFAAVFDAVRRGRVRAGVVPVENTVYGSIHETRDLLMQGGIVPVAEVTLRIRLCVLALPGATLRTIRTFTSQPQALGQCGRFLLSRRGVRVEPVTDTAVAARLVRDAGDLTLACIAGKQAARPYGLKVLREGVEDSPENYTRFLVIRKKADRTKPSRSGPTCTMVVASVRNRPGSLHRLLGAFAAAGVDLRSITARPQTGRPWEYVFHLDVNGSPSDPRMVDALDAARKVSILVRVIGSFGRARARRRMPAR